MNENDKVIKTKKPSNCLIMDNDAIVSETKEDSDDNLNPSFFQNPYHFLTVLEHQSTIIFSLFQPDKRWNTLRLKK
jgi:hypothetical protein